jgi:hypothetical protein
MNTPTRKWTGPITIMITRAERDLILRYGYPFEDIERQLKNSGDLDLMKVTDEPYWWEQVILNLRISEEEKPELQVDMALCDSLNEFI